MEGLKMVIWNENYKTKTIDFETGDYLKGISGTIDAKKNFTQVIFTSAKGEVYQCGVVGKYKRKVKMDKDDRPICLKLSLNQVLGTVNKKTCTFSNRFPYITTIL